MVNYYNREKEEKGIEALGIKKLEPLSGLADYELRHSLRIKTELKPLTTIRENSLVNVFATQKSRPCLTARADPYIAVRMQF